MPTKLLIVDDSRVVRDVIKVHLMGADGLEFLEATDGERALEMLRHADVDLVISDLHMPKLGGVALVRKLRGHQREAVRRVPIIMLTAAQSPEESKRECLDAGATDFVLKPVASANLLDVVLRHLPPRRDERSRASVRDEEDAMTRKTVLIVDDSKTALMATLAVVQQLPCEVVTAYDGAEAVKTARARRPDLILMDVVMPKMTGFEACKALRASAEMREVPIILLTTQRAPEKVQEGIASGCTEHLFKPVDGPALLAKVKGYLGL